VTKYSELNPQLLLATIAALERRIGERFPASGLRQVSIELQELAVELCTSTQTLGRPMWMLRIFTWLLIATGVAALIAVARNVFPMHARTEDLVRAVQGLEGLEAGVNIVILVVIGIAFLVSLETRLKRHRALASLHRVRSFVHIVDMHQLTKDPEHLLTPDRMTAASPAREMNRFELARYLDYCSELLSLASKLAALHAQYLHDSAVLEAVNDLETLVASLSSKIWQKITILDLAMVEPARPSSAPV
jgi:hypothetical protein